LAGMLGKVAVVVVMEEKMMVVMMMVVVVIRRIEFEGQVLCNGDGADVIYGDGNDVQCSYFFKRAQFFKKAGEKRALFQQKNGQKTGEKTGAFCFL